MTVVAVPVISQLTVLRVTEAGNSVRDKDDVGLLVGLGLVLGVGKFLGLCQRGLPVGTAVGGVGVDRTVQGVLVGGPVGGALDVGGEIDQGDLHRVFVFVSIVGRQLVDELGRCILCDLQTSSARTQVARTLVAGVIPAVGPVLSPASPCTVVVELHVLAVHQAVGTVLLVGRRVRILASRVVHRPRRIKHDDHVGLGALGARARRARDGEGQAVGAIIVGHQGLCHLGRRVVGGIGRNASGDTHGHQDRRNDGGNGGEQPRSKLRHGTSTSLGLMAFETWLAPCIMSTKKVVETAFPQVDIWCHQASFRAVCVLVHVLLRHATRDLGTLFPTRAGCMM